MDTSTVIQVITVDPDSEIPIYRQIANDLRTRFTSGDLQRRKKLPSEKDLQDQYAVARDTIRQALSELASLGLTRTVAGRGTYVRSTGVTVVGLEVGMRIFSRPATNAERDVMELGEGAWVLVIERAGGQVEVLPAESSEIRVGD